VNERWRFGASGLIGRPGTSNLLKRRIGVILWRRYALAAANATAHHTTPFEQMAEDERIRGLGLEQIPVIWGRSAVEEAGRLIICHDTRGDTVERLKCGPHCTICFVDMAEWLWLPEFGKEFGKEDGKSTKFLEA
jgi:hypothetical protein